MRGRVYKVKNFRTTQINAEEQKSGMCEGEEGAR